jgi:hypothetical protein
MRNPFVILVQLLASCALAQEQDGFEPLFNGRDLSGWTNVNCAPETWTINDGMIHCTGLPTGALRTTKQYENFILELEWRHLSSGGNSGIFIWSSPIAAPGVPFLRAIEVQVLDDGFNVTGKNEWYTTHGDVFPIHGSTMKPFGRHNGMRSFPSEERSKRTPEWNQYRIVCTNGVIRLHVNGKEVSGGENCDYRRGYIALESEGGPIDFRNIRLKELPSGGASQDLSAPGEQHWRSLFTGLDLRGWRTNSANGGPWGVEGERIVLKKSNSGQAGILWADSTFGDAEFVVDCRTPKSASAQDRQVPSVFLEGGGENKVEVKLEGITPGSYKRFFIVAKGREVSVRSENEPRKQLRLESKPGNGLRFGLGGNSIGVDFMNLYVREL